MTTRETAALLGVSPDTVLNLVKRGVLTPCNLPTSPVLKRPRRLLFRAADVAALAPPPRRLAEDTPGYDASSPSGV